MSNQSRLFQKLVIVFWLLPLGVPGSVSGNDIFPKAICFLEPVVCPANTQIEVVSKLQRDREGTYNWTKVFCVNNQREIDVTWKIF